MSAVPSHWLGAITEHSDRYLVHATWEATSGPSCSCPCGPTFPIRKDSSLSPDPPGRHMFQITRKVTDMHNLGSNFWSSCILIFLFAGTIGGCSRVSRMCWLFFFSWPKTQMLKNTACLNGLLGCSAPIYLRPEPQGLAGSDRQSCTVFDYQWAWPWTLQMISK